jgi:phosphoglycolate phosphatase-like HAD superfamily hydrolase
MTRAFQDLFGIDEAFSAILMAGRTDSWILADALAANSIAPDDPRVELYREMYFRHLARELLEPAPGKRYGVMPGVRELLEALKSRGDVYLALLTGNYEHAAEMKLSQFDLWKYFECGAFGDDAPNRNGLLGRALARVEACSGLAVAPANTVIIGDTPLDVGVAIAGGARSLAVATGNHSARELELSGADVVFEDLSDTNRVIQAIADCGTRITECRMRNAE